MTNLQRFIDRSIRSGYRIYPINTNAPGKFEIDYFYEVHDIIVEVVEEFGLILVRDAKSKS